MLSRLLQRRLARAERSAGFTIIELIVALTLLALLAAGAVPLLIAGAKAANAAKLHTQAKNFAQQRLEAMRDMQFHVDRQNGPFVDMLDVYYTNASLTAAPITQTRGGETYVGQYVASGTAPQPTTGPFYKVTIASLAGNALFRQEIDTQFLGNSGAPLPASKLTGYDSQVAGKDDPPSALVAVTVTTSWSDHGSTHNFTTYTRIADSRGTVRSLTSQGRGELARITSTGSSNNPLTVDLALAEADGSTTTGSTASTDLRALFATDGLGATLSGASGVATSPDGTVSQTSSNGLNAAASGCGWVTAGPTAVANLSAATVDGLPQVPSTVDTADPPVYQAASQLKSYASGACGMFSFSNQVSSYLSNLRLLPSVPLIRMPDTGGNTVVAQGSAWVNATTSKTSPHSVTSGAAASSTQVLGLFPNTDFTGGQPLVKILLNSSKLTCSSNVTSGSPAVQSAAGSYSATVSYWVWNPQTGSGSYVDKVVSWSSASQSGSTDPLKAIDPASILVYQSQDGATMLHLSDYIASWQTARKITENEKSGLHQLTGIVQITTRQVGSDALSSVGLQVGNLSCAADDSR